MLQREGWRNEQKRSQKNKDKRLFYKHKKCLAKCGLIFSILVKSFAWSYSFFLPSLESTINHHRVTQTWFSPWVVLMCVSWGFLPSSSHSLSVMNFSIFFKSSQKGHVWVPLVSMLSLFLHYYCWQHCFSSTNTPLHLLLLWQKLAEVDGTSPPPLYGGWPLNDELAWSSAPLFVDTWHKGPRHDGAWWVRQETGTGPGPPHSLSNQVNSCKNENRKERTKFGGGGGMCGSGMFETVRRREKESKQKKGITIEKEG